MKIGDRLVAGLFAIIMITGGPLLYALLSLNDLNRDLARMQVDEFAGSLLIGKVRAEAADLRIDEMRLAIFPSEEAAASMQDGVARLATLIDSLERHGLGEKMLALQGALSVVTGATQEHSQASLSRTDAGSQRADSIMANHIEPALESIRTTLQEVETDLHARTTAVVSVASDRLSATWRTAAIGFPLALALAFGIGFWLTRSITRPVIELDRAMSTVADGDYSYRLDLRSDHGSEFTRLSQSYRSMVKQLAELDKLKAEFVSVASHELKTPLNVVIGYLQLLDEGVYGDLSPEQREICATVHNQAQTLGRLVNQLLDASRFEAGGGRLETSELNLRELLGEIERSLQVLALQRDIAFTSSVAPDVPEHVVWDADRIREVLGNLVANALKFTERGGKVEIGVYMDEELVRIDVRDTGVGIPPEQLPLVFRKFYQADNQGSTTQRGSGLGLAIAKEIVDAHEGTIHVESTVDVGTMFSIILPVTAMSGRAFMSRRLTPAHLPESASSGAAI